MQEQEMAKKNLIFKAITGSKLYGTDTPQSDADYVGVFIPSKEYVLGTKTCEQVEFKTNPSDSGKRNTKTDVDMTLYSLPKFIKLCSQNNPNILELLFVDKNHTLVTTPYWEEIKANTHLFVSKKVQHTFLGYAHSQKQKVLTKNPEGNRKIYIEKFGYDVKFASHLIRLLVEGLELLNNGQLRFPITMNRYIRDVKEGKYPIEQVLTKADELESLILQSSVTSKLPYSPNYEELSKLQMNLLERYWKDNECSQLKSTTSDHKSLVKSLLTFFTK